MASTKQRADLLLVEKGLASSRTQAQALLMSGRVFLEEERVEKPGQLLRRDATVTVRGTERFVSRGGNKLDGALDDLDVDVTDTVAVDVGASTGGFTDCLLQRGARRVYAVDVGHGQLAEKLRQDPRVVNLERTNARHLDASSFPEPVTLTVVDASFISLEKLLPAIAAFLAPGGRLVAMVKPQFEVGREAAAKTRGVIKDPQLRKEAIDRVLAATGDHGFEVVATADSRVAGPKGNVECFFLARRT